jgi:predicted GIY-YIG superfamily endonuclease
MSRKFQDGQTHFDFFTPKTTRLEAIQRGEIPEEYRGDLTVYLLHFRRPVGSEKHSARHYVGVCQDLRQRLKQHRRGKNGSAITNELKRRKIGFITGHVWTGVNREFERYIKAWKHHSKFCEICQDVPFFDTIPTFYGGKTS